MDLTWAPYRQEDPRWKDEVMWQHDLVWKLAQEADMPADDLLSPDSGDATLATDGCMVTSLAMILRLLHERDGGYWTPKHVHRAAIKEGFYRPSGLSTMTMYADLVSELTKGKVQLACKEDYLAGRDGWYEKRVFSKDCHPLRAYLRLSPLERVDFAVMLKIGTWDDTFASHFVVVNPESVARDVHEVILWDPAMPAGKDVTSWTLTAACHNLATGKIGKEWRKQGIEIGQISGIYVFAHWKDPSSSPLLGRLIDAMALETGRRS